MRRRRLPPRKRAPFANGLQALPPRKGTRCLRAQGRRGGRRERRRPERRPRQYSPAVMSPVATVISTLAGPAIIVLALRDIFDALFHQGARGVLSRWIMRGTWWVFHRLTRVRRGLLPIAGPTMLLLIVVTWAGMLAIGWALIYWPHMPQGFLLTSPPSELPLGHLIDSLYISLVTLSTIGFGDITPAYEVSLLREAEQERGLGVSELDDGGAESLFAELTSRLVTVERDLVTVPISYYFAASDRRFALSSVMPYLLERAERGCREELRDSLRLREMLLREAIDDFARTTAARFHGHRSESTQELLEAYGRDHFRDPEREKIAYDAAA